MQFNSLAFLVFLPIVVGIYFALPAKRRWAWLLFASYFFYGYWKVGYLLLIVVSTIVDYYAAIALERVQGETRRKWLLAASLGSNLGLLFVFKYFNFFADSLNGLAVFAARDGEILPHLDLLLPIGISFYTFQTLSYTIDVYRRHRLAERHFGIFALYVSFFPQLVAGPIERSNRLLPQFHREFRFEYMRVTSGLRLMLWGLFKKIVIADRLALIVDWAYGNPTELAGPYLLLGTIFFALQIYCDFSGYSDIAVGTARLMGFDLMQNFRSPYFSKSITEYWRRWHISLTTWFRDYLFIPLGGGRLGTLRTNLNILAVFVVSGAWHGANWNFILWGTLHGLLLIVERSGRALIPWDRIPRLPFSGALQTLVCFTIVSLSLVFFRANTVGEAFAIFGQLPMGWETLADAGAFFENLPVSPGYLLLSLVAIVPFLCVDFQVRDSNFSSWLEDRPRMQRWGIYYLLCISILLLGEFDSRQFIYFQF